jgi:hypothetical protein
LKVRKLRITPSEITDTSKGEPGIGVLVRDFETGEPIMGVQSVVLHMGIEGFCTATIVVKAVDVDVLVLDEQTLELGPRDISGGECEYELDSGEKFTLPFRYVDHIRRLDTNQLFDSTSIYCIADKK